MASNVPVLWDRDSEGLAPRLVMSCDPTPLLVYLRVAGPLDHNGRVGIEGHYRTCSPALLPTVTTARPISLPIPVARTNYGAKAAIPMVQDPVFLVRYPCRIQPITRCDSLKGLYLSL